MNRRSLLAGLLSLASFKMVLGSVKKNVKDSTDTSPETASTVAFIEQDICIQCGVCFTQCPVAAILQKSEKEKQVFTVSPSACIACGVCVESCPVEAISWTTPTPVEDKEDEKL